MNEEVQMFLDEAQENMMHAIEHLERELMKIRAGKANTHMLDSIFVDNFGTQSPLHHVANIGTTDARTIQIQPWDKKMIPVIEKEIMKANLGFNPENNGEVIRINVPPLTEERRKDLVKQARHEGEEAKISIRSARRDANDGMRSLKNDGVSEDLIKGGEDEVQKFTNDYTKQVDEIMSDKEAEIMTV